MSRFTVFAFAFVTGLALSLGSAWAVEGQDKQKEGRGPDAAETFKKLDTNADGKLTLDEFKAGKVGKEAEQADAHFKKMDKDNDGSLTLAEFKSGWQHGKEKSGEGREKREERQPQ